MRHLGLVKVGCIQRCCGPRVRFRLVSTVFLRGYYGVFFAWHHDCRGCSLSLLQSVGQRQRK